MADEFSPEALNTLAARMAEMAAWTSLNVTLEDIAKDNAALVAELVEFDVTTTVALLSSLLTLPTQQAQCLRLELLAVLALIHCNGERVATVVDASRWHTAIGESQSASGEDPAEDVFVSLAGNDQGSYRLLEGIWEGAGFYTQRMVEVVDAMPRTGLYNALKRSVQAVLRLSDAVCARADLVRYATGSDNTRAPLDTGHLDAPTLRGRVAFTGKALRDAGIAIADLAPFILDAASIPLMASDVPGSGIVEQRPLLRTRDGLLVILPTALSIALRHAVIVFATRTGQATQINQALANVYSRTVYRSQVFGGSSGLDIQWELFRGTRVATHVVPVDVGHPMIIQFVLPSIEHHTGDGFRGIIELDEETEAFIDARIGGFIERIGVNKDFQRGMVVRVGCGWGAGFSSGYTPPADPRWQYQWMSGADFIRMGSLSDMSPADLWRVQDAVKTAGRAGVAFLNVNGILNLIGWVRDNDGHVVPHGQLPEGRITPDRPLMMTLPTNLLRDVRIEADTGYDRHSARDNTGRWHRVMRPSASDFFPSERIQRFYASLDDIDHGTLGGVSEGHASLWATFDAPNMKDRGVIYELWNTVRVWLGRIDEALAEVAGPRAAGKIVKARLVLEDGDDVNHFIDTPPPANVHSFWHLKRTSEQRAIRVVFRKGFLSAFRAADNRAERAVVRALGTAYATLMKLPNAGQVGEDIERLAVPDDIARSFHMMEGREFGDWSRRFLTRPLLTIEDVESAAARIELGWKAAAPDAPLHYQGKKPVGKLLGDVVDVLVRDIIEQLGKLDRRATLQRLLENAEHARADERRWHLTAAAVLALHAGEEGAEDVVSRELGRFAGAQITSRIVLEMAICACPLEGGMAPSDMALTKLLARAALLSRIGGLSDAVRFGALAADVAISPLGDILFQDDFGRMVVEPMLALATNERFADSAAGYKSNYVTDADESGVGAEGEAGDADTADDKELAGFKAIWLGEMGFSVEDNLHLVHAIERMGVAREAAVFVACRSELTEVARSAGLADDTIDALFSQYVLSSRPSWDKVPEAFRLGDIYPWRFGRRLSVVTRPLLQFGEGEDPQILVAPGLFRTASRYLFTGAYSGRLNRDFFRSDAMRDEWLGEAREGHTFEHTLAGRLHAAGWTVRNGIGFPEILGRHPGFDPGDIDILAWRADRNAILVIECKDLSMARNYSEAASQLTEYQGENTNGRADKLRKHLRRVDLARAHVNDLARFTGVTTPEVVSWLFSAASPRCTMHGETLRPSTVHTSAARTTCSRSEQGCASAMRQVTGHCRPDRVPSEPVGAAFLATSALSRSFSSNAFCPGQPLHMR
ncbi:hypothetical protein [Xanthomonas sp. NCPPB 2632]|uniref:hypothetical protein n=1 Tax=Xanthomonas sp. NCPPB 2632 TaxID=3240912 RepID=UPI003512E9F1